MMRFYSFINKLLCRSVTEWRIMLTSSLLVWHCVMLFTWHVTHCVHAVLLFGPYPTLRLGASAQENLPFCLQKQEFQQLLLFEKWSLFSFIQQTHNKILPLLTYKRLNEWMFPFGLFWFRRLLIVYGAESCRWSNREYVENWWSKCKFVKKILLVTGVMNI